LSGRQNEATPSNAKAEMNTNFASWKLMQKKLTDWIRKHSDITNELGQISVDEIAECAIYDANQVADR